MRPEGDAVTAPPDRPIPLYAPETPLPAVAYVPGRTARPGAAAHPAPHAAAVPASERSASGRTGDRAPLAASPAFRHGVDLFNHGFYWEAHEAWEELWLPLPRDGVESALLQGLIQAAAALLKLRTGARSPAATIWERGRARLVQVAERSPHGVALGVPIDAVISALDVATKRGALPEPPPLILLA